jgi:hypothetical protein
MTHEGSDSGTAEPAASTTKRPAMLRGIPGLVLVAVLIPGLFWLSFGRIDGFVIGFTAFLVLLAAAAEYLPAISERAAARQAAMGNRHPRYQPRWTDMLGVLWLLAIPFAPALAWFTRNVTDLNAANWYDVVWTTTLLCVALPIICAASLLRFIRRGNVLLASAILALGTGFPVATGLPSAYDAIAGPQWQNVTVVRLLDVDYRTRVGTRIAAPAVYLELSDGRQLTRTRNVAARLGPARLLVLRGNRHIIAAAPQ